MFLVSPINAARVKAHGNVDDKLVIAVGSTSNDHGVQGLEHCFQLKTVPDAQAIRRRVMSESTVAQYMGSACANAI